MGSSSCDLVAAAAAACRSEIGETFVDFDLGHTHGHYVHGCDPKCGSQTGPEASADFEKGSNTYLIACNPEGMVQLTFERGSELSRIGIYSDPLGANGNDYTLTGWTAGPSDSNTQTGTAQATNVADPSDTVTLELSYKTCD